MEKKVMPTSYFLVLLFLSVILHFSFPIRTFSLYSFNYLGIALIAFGIIINVWADGIFKKNNTTVKPHKMPSVLVITGPFAISRHPMYLGMASVLLGTAIFFGSLVCFIFPIVFILLMEKIFIPVEEKNLENIFRERYEQYKRRVRKWI